MEKKVNKSEKAIKVALYYIVNNKSYEFSKLMNLIPLDKLSSFDSDILLVRLLSTCEKYKRENMLPIIFILWENIYPNTEKIPLYVLLLMNRLYSDELMKFILHSKPEPDTYLSEDILNIIASQKDHNEMKIKYDFERITFSEIIDNLISYDSSPNISYACTRLIKIYGEQNYKTYKWLKNLAIDGGNTEVEDFMTLKIKQTAPFQPIPKWVQNFRDGPIPVEGTIPEPQFKEKIIQLPDDFVIVEKLTEGLSQQGITIIELDLAKQKLTEFLKNATREEKLKLISPILKNESLLELAYNKDIFRLYGPAHPLVDQDLTEDTPSSKFGGCRMFLCDIYDYDEDFDIVRDWFNGSCDICNNRIRMRWHAVRMPKPQGGWYGCYCSWECVKKDVNHPAIAQLALINAFEKSINQIGIQSRKAREK